MARLGFFMCGIDGTPLPNITPELSIPAGSYLAASYVDNDVAAHAFVWRYRTLRMDWNVSVTNPVGAPDALLGSVTTNNIPSSVVDENDIARQANQADPITFDVYGIRQFGTTPGPPGTFNGASFDIFINSFDPSTGNFTFNYEFALQGSISQVNSQAYGNGITTIVVTILGQSASAFCANTIFGPVTGTIDVVPDTYWAYDDGSGPIWNDTTGAQLITPVPRNYG